MGNDGIMQYFAKFGLDASDFLNGLSKSQDGLLAFARDVTVTMNMTMQIFDRVTASVNQFGQMANDLRDLSLTTGIATDKLQQFHYAAVISGTSVYSVDASLQKLSLSMNEAKDSSSAAAAAFARLGVDPSGKSVDEVFDSTAFALMNVKDETERNSIAMDIYGRSWKDLIPYMETYIEKSDEIKKSPIISQKELDDLAEAKVGWDKLNNGLTIYSGKALAFIADLQEKTNNLNPFYRLLTGQNPVESAGGADIGSPTIPGAGGSPTAPAEGAGSGSGTVSSSGKSGNVSDVVQAGINRLKSGDLSVDDVLAAYSKGYISSEQYAAVINGASNSSSYGTSSGSSSWWYWDSLTGTSGAAAAWVQAAQALGGVSVDQDGRYTTGVGATTGRLGDFTNVRAILSAAGIDASGWDNGALLSKISKYTTPEGIAAANSWKPDSSNIIIEINQANSGTASPDAIAAATAKAVSEAIASQVREW